MNPRTNLLHRFVGKEIDMQALIEKARRCIRDEEGVTAIEYGLIAALIALVIIGSVTLLGTNLSSVFSTIAASV